MAKQFFPPFHLWNRRQNEEEHQTRCYYGHRLQTVLKMGEPAGATWLSVGLSWLFLHGGFLMLRFRLHLVIKTVSFGHRPETGGGAGFIRSRKCRSVVDWETVGLVNFPFRQNSVELSCCRARWGLSTADYYSFTSLWKIFQK